MLLHRSLQQILILRKVTWGFGKAKLERHEEVQDWKKACQMK